MSRPERGWAYAAISVLFVAAMMATTLPFEVHLVVLVVSVILGLGLAYRDRTVRTGPVMIVSRPSLGLPESGRGTFIRCSWPAR